VRLGFAALVVLGGCLAAELWLQRVGIDDLDEGYFAQQATRVLLGQVPFRDFETLYAPGLAYLHAALFWLAGGPSLLVLRSVSLAARAALVGSLYAITLPLVRRKWLAAVPGMVILVAFDDAPERWEPHPGWLSALFAILAAWTLERTTRSRGIALAGALAALSFAFKQNTGVFMLLAIVLWTQRRSLPAVLAFAGVTLLWLVPLAVSVGVDDLGAMAVLVGAVNQAGLVSPPEPSIAIALICLLAGVWLPKQRWLFIAAIALFLTQYPRMDTLHLAWSAPLLLVLGALALDRLHIGLVFAALALIAVEAAPIVASRLEFVGLPRAPIAGVEAPVQTAHDLASLVADIQQRTRPGEPIFVYPTSPLVYVLSDRPNPTRFDHLNPGSATPAQVQRTIDDLERSTVKVVVISDFWEDAWGPPGPNAPLVDWIASHFQEAARYGAYRVLTPRI
jgi:hypothetical protein